jgi:tetratricopeptide (TPR) repeat protein
MKVKTSMVRVGVAFTALLVGGAVAPRLAHAQSSAGVSQDVQDCTRFFESQDFRKAAKKCDAAIAADSKVGPGTYSLRASIFVVEKQYEEGVRWIETVAERAYPGDPVILEQKAAMLSRVKGREKDAITVAEQVVAKDSKRFIAQKLVGDYYARAGAGKAAVVVDAYEAYLRNRPEDNAKADGLVRVQLGFAYMYVGISDTKADKFKQAELQFDKALAGGGGKDATVAPNALKGKCAALVGRAGIEVQPRLYDQAITICEGVIKNRKALRGDASPYYNVGIAYLERNQLDKAINAANSYINQRPREFRGYLLRGKIYFRQDKYNEAEGQFNRANELSPNNTEVALARGKNYSKQGQPVKAITLLERVASVKPNDVDVMEELAHAYLKNNEASKAAMTAERALAVKGQADNVALLVLAGDSYYAAADLSPARQKYTKARELNKANVSAKNGLIDTIVRQAFARFDKGNTADAQKLLLEAYAVDSESQIANFNLGVIALDQGQFQDAIKYLKVRVTKTPDDLPTNRLLAKAYLSIGNNQQAADFYAKAEALAKSLRNNPVLAEIYTEWAPLLIEQGKLDDAVDKLEIADQFSSNQPFQKATQRNLQVAYFRRGYDRWRQRKAADAVSDLEGAVRYPANLRPGEEDAFTFALGLAYLSAGMEGKATPIFSKYAKAGVLSFLKAPWDKIGAEFFMAYTWYREGTAASKKNAAVVFEKLAGKSSGGIQGKIKDLLRSSWEAVAFDAWTHGDARTADLALKKAEAFAAPNAKRVIDHNAAVLDMSGGKRGAAAQAVFSRLGEDPPEALYNLGIIEDQSGNSKRAYDLWVTAKAKGVKTSKLDEWIDAKKRIFGF